MLINYVPGAECRIAVVADGKLDEFYHERGSSQSHVGNIYKGRVTNVESSIQAAFIDFGLERNGFLHVSDLHPMYFPGKDREEFERVGSKTPRRERPPIQKCLRRGQEVLVQVLKEGIGTKGPTLTSYLSIPGRFVVMMPNMQRLGVSRKVDDDDARRETRKLLAELDPPEGFGFIVRTAGVGQTKTDLKRDLAYLQRLWKAIETRRKQIRTVGELYTESDLIIRTLRDVFTTDISQVVIDNAEAAQRARDFLAIASPRTRSKVMYYKDPVPLFHRYGVESQIDGIFQREVPLPSGGSLVIEPTEALVAIDVNSGKSREATDSETNAYNTNLEATDEICRQLRLRDLGGVIINDLIDMRDGRRRRKIESRFRENLKKDRARTRIANISPFGILEMTRQRMRPSLSKALTIECTHCGGNGLVKSPESVVLDVMRRLALIMQYEQVARVELTVSPDTAFHLLNGKRADVVALEQQFDTPVLVRVGGQSTDYIHITAFDSRDGRVDIDALVERLARQSKDDGLVEVTRVTPPEALDAAEPDLESRDEDDEQAPDQPGGDDKSAEAGSSEEEEEGRKKRRRKRRRGSRGKKRKSDDQSDSDDQQDTQTPADATDESSADEATQEGEEPEDDAQVKAQDDTDASADASSGDQKGKRGRRKRSPRGKKEDAGTETADEIPTRQESQEQTEPQQPQKQQQDKRERQTKKRSKSAAKVAASSRGYANRITGSEAVEAILREDQP